MADDRYTWLDEEAAERLLRGEPAIPSVRDDERARAQAERLSAVLAGMAREPVPGGTLHHGLPNGELPGEAAAAAAFRKAREARDDTSRAGSTRDDAPVDPASQVVRIGRPGWPSRFRGLGRPLRAGFAVAVAGCALGGVAVAAGVGVLPTPFGGSSGEPAPGASVSAVSTQEPQSGDPSTVGGSGEPSRSPSASTSGTDGPGGAPSDGAGHEHPGDGAGNGTAVDPGRDGMLSAEKLKETIALCRKHEAGTLDKRMERKLERDAGGRHAVDRYCDRALDRAAENKDSGSGESGDSRDSPGNSEKGDKGNKDEDDDDGSEGGTSDFLMQSSPTAPPSEEAPQPSPSPSASESSPAAP
ncbi:hypothetical protein [Streptomyces sp. KR80]|uniref:hypothetical protein n=1 Tax=Streptomyces sp. KR80 TaxID=3457426 RepID=UPI003FD51ED8